MHYQTAWEWARDGKMPVPVVKTPSGSWLVLEPEPASNGRVVAYCRVSCADQEPDLDRQVARVVQGATAQGLVVGEVVTEIGSGLNGKRRKLHRILSDASARVVTCGEIDPEVLSDLDIAALRWAGVDPFNHSTWAVHRGDCGR